MEKYSIRRPIGSGVYSTVYSGTDRATGESVALKQVALLHAGPNVNADSWPTQALSCTAIREGMLLSRMQWSRHEGRHHVIQLLDIVFQPDGGSNGSSSDDSGQVGSRAVARVPLLWMVLERCETDMFSFLANCKSRCKEASDYHDETLADAAKRSVLAQTPTSVHAEGAGAGGSWGLGSTMLLTGAKAAASVSSQLGTMFQRTLSVSRHLPRTGSSAGGPSHSDLHVQLASTADSSMPGGTSETSMDEALGLDQGDDAYGYFSLQQVGAGPSFGGQHSTSGSDSGAGQGQGLARRLFGASAGKEDGCTAARPPIVGPSTSVTSAAGTKRRHDDDDDDDEDEDDSDAVYGWEVTTGAPYSRQVGGTSSQLAGRPSKRQAVSSPVSSPLSPLPCAGCAALPQYLTWVRPGAVGHGKASTSGSTMGAAAAYRREDFPSFPLRPASCPGRVTGATVALNPALVKSWAGQLLAGVAALHEAGIMHRDLKPANLLLRRDGSLAIADLGLSRVWHEGRYKATADGVMARPASPMGRSYGPPTQRVFTHEVVTLWYRAPEVLLGGPLGAYGPAVDTWSIGVILLEMMRCGRPVWPGSSETDQLLRMFKCLGTPTDRDWPALGQGEYRDWHGKQVVTVEGRIGRPSPFPTFPVPGGSTRAALARLLPAPYAGDPACLDLLAGLLAWDPLQRLTPEAAMGHAWFLQR